VTWFINIKNFSTFYNGLKKVPSAPYSFERHEVLDESGNITPMTANIYVDDIIDAAIL
jgi:hypothetical protein